MQSYAHEAQQQQEVEEFKQDLGLRKMLYKYQHENEQLRNQIRALTERLQAIMSSKTEHHQAPKQSNSSEKNINEAHERYLQEQMRYFLKRIEQINGEIKQHKEMFDEAKEQEYVRLTNTLKDKDNKLQLLKNKVDKFRNQFEWIASSGPIQSTSTAAGISNEELETKYTNQLEDLRKRVRELQRTKHNNHKQDINRHMHMVSLQTRTRKIISQPLRQSQNLKESNVSPQKKGGLWGMDLTEENYQNIAEEFERLKKQKNVLLDSIKVQNNGLREKLARLKNEYVDLSARTNINQSMTLSVPKKQLMTSTPKQNTKKTIVLPDIPVPLGNSAYQRKNDKNFVPKKIRLMQWNVNKGKKSPLGFAWNDQNSKSPITGINIWLDKYLIGIQFIHTLGETNQHYHCEGGDTKKLVPIQYRLNSNDYLQNIILVIWKANSKSDTAQNSIVGLQLISKNGRKDTFGFKVGTANTQKYDFQIRNPQKPVYSFGSFTINSSTHLSCISSLGFAII